MVRAPGADGTEIMLYLLIGGLLVRVSECKC